MRILLALALLAVAASAQWALDPSALGYRGWTVDAAPSLPASFSATVQLLPTPYWQEWVLGNWTTAFALGRGCVVQGGPLRYGIYVPQGAYIETPAVKLEQNFTVVVTYRPRYIEPSDVGWSFLWRKESSTWFGEISGTYETYTVTAFRTMNAIGVDT
jgi:hypothetical protein